MKNEKQEIYKNFKIINFNDIYIIVDYKGLTQGETTTREQARQKIDNIIKEQEQKQKVFDSLKELNNTTQKAICYLHNFETSKKKDLWECYKTNYSQKKQNAFNDCLKIFDTLQGNKRKIPTYNQNIFTFSFDFIFNNQKYLCYITPTNNYKIKID